MERLTTETRRHGERRGRAVKGDPPPRSLAFLRVSVVSRSSRFRSFAFSRSQSPGLFVSFVEQKLSTATPKGG
jgi:hypothetical protein